MICRRHCIGSSASTQSSSSRSTSCDPTSSDSTTSHSRPSVGPESRVALQTVSAGPICVGFCVDRTAEVLIANTSRQAHREQRSGAMSESSVVDGQVSSEPTAGRRGFWRRMSLTRAEWARLGGFAGAVLFLHLLGWGLFLYFARHNPALAGLGSLAYTFGLRHAFDADHIAAIDNTTRKLLQDGKRPMGVGFFFSLGHSTIVFSLAAGLAIAAKTVNSQIPGFQDIGGYIGASVSGHVPDRHRPPQPRRAARHPWCVPADEARCLQRAEARGGAAEPGSDEPLLPEARQRQDRRELEDVSARNPVRPRFRHSHRDRPPRDRRRCRDAQRARSSRSSRFR